MSALSEIDIKDWDRAENIIDNLEVSNPETYSRTALYSEDYVFLMQLIKKARKTYKVPKIPAILSWWKA
jgi:hypothetical protein